MPKMHMGNPETSDAEDRKGLIDYAWTHAVVSDSTDKTVRESCDFNCNSTWSNDDYSQAVDEVPRQYHEWRYRWKSPCVGHKIQFKLSRPANYLGMEALIPPEAGAMWIRRRQLKI